MWHDSQPHIAMQSMQLWQTTGQNIYLCDGKYTADDGEGPTYRTTITLTKGFKAELYDEKKLWVIGKQKRITQLVYKAVNSFCTTSTEWNI